MLSPKDVLELVPQQEPFRFLDDIVEIDDEHIVTVYTFRPESDFYRGHFPGFPLTPGVLLLEAAAQSTVVAHGLYIASQTMPIEELKGMMTVFTEATVEFTGMVRPGDRITVRGTKKYFRRRKLKVEVEASLDDGTVVLSGTLAGMGVSKDVL